MTNAIIEMVLTVVSTLLVTLIGALGTWLTVKITKGKELQNINIAKDAVINAAQLTVLELQQTVVEGWKEANEDGKLTDAEVSALGKLLLQKTKEKLSMPVQELIEAAGVDIVALIQGAGEAYIASLKREDNATAELGEPIEGYLDDGEYLTATTTATYTKEPMEININEAEE